VGACGTLWAKHPKIAGSNLHHVHAVSSRVTPSPPSRRRAAQRAVAATRFTTVPETPKALPHCDEEFRATRGTGARKT
jgi:hypothetical protein